MVTLGIFVCSLEKNWVKIQDNKNHKMTAPAVNSSMNKGEHFAATPKISILSSRSQTCCNTLSNSSILSILNWTVAISRCKVVTKCLKEGSPPTACELCKQKHV